jgi:hypothetical protein
MWALAGQSKTAMDNFIAIYAAFPAFVKTAWDDGK